MCVLLVEDEWMTLLAADIALEAAGYEVLTAGHGQNAVDHIEANPGYFTCLVTDYHMLGDITGAHVVERMRPDYPAIPMILTTANPEVVVDAWLQYHAMDLLPKPYEVGDLVAILGERLT